MNSMSDKGLNKGFRCYHLAAACIVPALLLVSACSTSITDYGSLQVDDTGRWSPVVDQLPVELHGTIKGRSAAELAELFPSTIKAPRYASLGPVAVSPLPSRIVFYIDQAELPEGQALCKGGFQGQQGAREGEFAQVTAALCDGPRLVSYATGRLRAPQEDGFLKSGFQMFDAQLVEALDRSPPGAND